MFKVRLIPLLGQHEMSLLLTTLLGDFLLTTHRIDGYGAALEGQSLEQFRDRGDLARAKGLGLFYAGDLAQR